MTSDINIRYAVEEDTAEIVRLLKTGLGEARIPKSIEYWNWKHSLNPFGGSLILLAEAEGKVIGVRSFMKWRWKSGDTQINSVRGVDTVVHPAYQGRKLFGKMTLELAKRSSSEGNGFLFSTPNIKSRGAYRKMGWEVMERLPVRIKILKPFSIMANVLLDTGKDSLSGVGDSPNLVLNRPDFHHLLSRHQMLLASCIITCHSVETLIWRYRTVPIVKYFATYIENEGLQAACFYRIKVSRSGKELRVTDIFTQSFKYLDELAQLLYRAAERNHVDFLTIGPFQGNEMFRGLLSLKTNHFGPIVTIKKFDQMLTLEFDGFQNWQPSLGDLELF